jgi:glycosyltransferase involved in cell wall biosynthesis
MASVPHPQDLHVALLTAGRDHPYAYGMATALMTKGFPLDIIGGDDLDVPLWSRNPRVTFFNLRGDISDRAGYVKKIVRIFDYYVRLILYALKTRATVFHVLWNNKFETFDRVPLMLFYSALGKKTVLTVHNVNTRERDARDSALNRFTLKIQYRLVDCLFVHTERMKRELVTHYDVEEGKITVIPFGINNAVAHTGLSPQQARHRLGISENDRTILFFGNIAPYKGLEYLIEAFRLIMLKDENYRLIIAGSQKNCADYWSCIQDSLDRHPNRDRIIQKISFIPDAETELYFKAADVSVLPYRHIFQSGVLSLSYSFGLPVIASDVGTLREDIIEGQTGFMCKPENPVDLAVVIAKYFASDLFHDLDRERQHIREYARERYSWDLVSVLTKKVYMQLVGKQSSENDFQLTA